MNQMSGEKRLRHLFQPVKWVGFDVKNRVKYGACCVSNYNSRDGFITERELARTIVRELPKSQAGQSEGRTEGPRLPHELKTSALRARAAR